MSTSAFTGQPDLDYSYVDVLPVTVIEYGGKGREQRVSWQALARRNYTWPMHRGSAERRNIDTFFRTQNYQVTSFYIVDPRDAARTAVSLGTAVSGQTTFSLPASGEESRYYPMSGTMTVYDDAVAMTCTVTEHVDARTVGLSTSPTTGSVMTCAFTGYRLVRLAEPFEWQTISPDWFFCEPVLREVPE